MYLSKIIKLSFLSILFLIFFSPVNCFSQNPFNVNNLPRGNQNQNLRKSNNRKIKYKNELDKKFMDISLVSGTTFSTYQTFISTGIQFNFFIYPVITAGFKFSRELLFTYDNIYQVEAVLRWYFFEQGEIIPFLHVESGYSFGGKLNGFLLRPGIGILYFVYMDFSIFLGVLFDLWFFTYRKNENDSNIPYNEVKLDKTYYDIRIMFGFSFLINL